MATKNHQDLKIQRGKKIPKKDRLTLNDLKLGTLTTKPSKFK